eukprot:1387911-Pyramimonas_sp.AAC.1
MSSRVGLRIAGGASARSMRPATWHVDETPSGMNAEPLNLSHHALLITTVGPKYRSTRIN